MIGCTVGGRLIDSHQFPRPTQVTWNGEASTCVGERGKASLLEYKDRVAY